jgi:predicted transcriptional regulator
MTRKFNLTKRIKNDILISLNEMKIKQLKRNLLSENYLTEAIDNIAEQIMLEESNI